MLVIAFIEFYGFLYNTQSHNSKLHIFGQWHILSLHKHVNRTVFCLIKLVCLDDLFEIAVTETNFKT